MELDCKGASGVFVVGDDADATPRTRAPTGTPGSQNIKLLLNKHEKNKMQSVVNAHLKHETRFKKTNPLDAYN